MKVNKEQKLETINDIKIKGIRYCKKCCMPETVECGDFDSNMGVCTACQSSEQKMHISWKKREEKLKEILNSAKSKAGSNYDCILPISGGKDSFFQAHVLTKVYGMKPLAVTFSHNWFSETGYYNLQRCLEVFDLDHMMYTPNRKLVNNIAKRSLEMIGDTCWSCHAGVGAFPLHVACKFNIPLLIYGESIAEDSGRASYFEPTRKFDREYFTKVSAKVEPKDMVCEYLSYKDLLPFDVPSVEECEEKNIFGIHLGDYIFWDEEKQTEFVKKEYGWRETEMEGAYKGYKSAECIMAGMHDFTCYLKRGYGRTSHQASVDIRKGILTREEGFELIDIYDRTRPEALDYYLEITGMTEMEFYKIMEEKKLDLLKNTLLPIRKKNHKNGEVIKPFPIQIIEKNLDKEDPRIKNKN